jgi:proteasome assembly chaperone 2
MSLYVSQEELDFSNKTIILGIPSVGNVGQLALDFLISSFDAKRVGFLDSQYILPVVGNDPYLTEKSKTGELHTSAEVYSIPSVDSVLLIIIRAPITSAKRFANELIQWLIQAKITKLVVLSSANSSWRMDNMIRNQ